MPPKPWLTKNGPPRQDVSAIIQSNPTMKQQIPKMSMQQPMIGPSLAQQSNGLNATTMNGLGTGIGGLGTTGYGSSIGGYGSSMGGYGSSMGGYGSSMGGYGSSMGGYGSSYGGYGGGSSYGMGGGYGMGYGRSGMMGNNDPNQRGFVMNTLMTLESLGFLIGSFCEIGRSLDQNVEGLHLFYNSFGNLFKKMYSTIKNGCSWLGQKTKNILLGILDFIKTYVLFMKHQDPKNRMKSLKLIINVSVVVLVITLYPQIKKVLNKVS